MRASFFGAALTALSVVMAANANATIVGSTYDFTASSSGSTLIVPNPSNGTYTDPSNPGFCVGPPTACGTVGEGLSGSFTFAQSTPTLDTITFYFSGSTSTGLSGSFAIDLGNFVTTDGETITGVTYASGNLLNGDFSNVSWNGTDAVFTGTPDGSGYYNAIGGVHVTFDVSTVPEPGSLALLGAALVGFGSVGSIGRRRKRRQRVVSPSP